MSTTGFSTFYRRELDVQQLITLLRQGQHFVQDWDVVTHYAEFLKNDVVCPSCGRGGANPVRPALSTKGDRIVRQGHFRFLSTTGDDAHHPFCEFYSSGDTIAPTGETVPLGSDNSSDTAMVRRLVCRGIATHVFDQSNIRHMRQWFFDLKGQSSFRIDVSENDIEWARCLRRHQHYIRQQFDPRHADMPGFDWRQATHHEFTEQYLHLFDLVRDSSHEQSHWKRAAQFASKHQGQITFDRGTLRPFYEATIAVAKFVAKNSGIQWRKGKPDTYRYDNAPPALLALCALCLFIKDWSTNEAIATFARLLNLPDPADQTLGNVLGLNPFHDFDAWRIVSVAKDVSSASGGAKSYAHLLADVEKGLRERYRVWKQQAQI
ncbi:hypothetical protein [Rhizobium johnstonii]|uniref:hypothetical protein n=1 Tax=Rhizobium johnstonii TaxID=3019933 RepID=UPI003F94CBF9